MSGLVVDEVVARSHAAATAAATASAPASALALAPAIARVATVPALGLASAAPGEVALHVLISSYFPIVFVLILTPERSPSMLLFHPTSLFFCSPTERSPSAAAALSPMERPL